MADGTAPSADGGDSGRAPWHIGWLVVVKGSQGGMAVADGGSSGGRWRIEANGSGWAEIEPAAVVEVGSRDILCRGSTILTISTAKFSALLSI